MFTYGLENQMIDARWCEIASYNTYLQHFSFMETTIIFITYLISNTFC